MKPNRLVLFLVSAGVLASIAGAEQLKVTADRIAADRVSESLVASGHVVAVSMPYRLLSDYCRKDAANVTYFADPTMVTTCTNELGHLHWSLTAEAEYADGRYVSMNDTVLRLWEVPVLWVPYWRYPLDGECGLRVMPGYTSHWGAYLLTKYVYPIAGDETRREGSYYLHGNTRMDLRWMNGLALGETLYWQLGDYGKGKFKIYYAWDADHNRYSDNWNNHSDWNYRNWSSEVPGNRYGIEFEHRWEATERDTLRVSGQVFSDSHFTRDFCRDSTLGIRNRWDGYEGNEFAWEHLGERFGAGVSVSGPLNEFIEGVSRLPEFYFDLQPTPVAGLPANYETENRLGFLRRQAARYGDAAVVSPYSFLPGEWADYQSFRFDTYHRLTAPFKVQDILSVVPRLGYRGTYWGTSGFDNFSGNGVAGDDGGDLFRSIVEGGVTFSARGVADFENGLRHVIEPYFDVLAQEAWYSGLGGGNRPYRFDSLDSSQDWSEQFAGRSRNLPYSYYGVTPGVRNVLRDRDERGVYRVLFDFDLYAALQFNRSDLRGDEWHELSDPRTPNYGENPCTVVPGFRLRYFPAEDLKFSARFEYDAENNRSALADLRLSQRVNTAFSWYISFAQRDYRWWDFSSAAYDPALMRSEDFNRVHFSIAEIGFEHELCDAVAWSPYLRWDCREGEVDTVGGWIDFRTDCLGFRFIMEYENEYQRIDGSRYKSDYSVGFYVYLRAFGPGSGLAIGD